MSGAEASLVIGLISAVISIIETTKKVYDAAQDAKGQPEVFGKVAAKLPLVLKILQNAKSEAGKVDEDRQDEVEITMEACRAKAEKLQKIFFKVARKDDDGWFDRYKKAVQMVTKGKRVEELMKEILEDIQVLACDKLMGSATEVQVKELTDAIKEMNEMQPSIVDDAAGSINQSNRDGGHNFALSGPGTMKNALGAFYDVGGNATFNNNDEVSGSKFVGSALYFSYHFHYGQRDLPEPSERQVDNYNDLISQFPKFGNSEAFRCLPICDVSITVEVDSTVSRTTLTQTFLNCSDIRIPDSNYTFPLYDGATIISFRVAGVLEGTVKKTADARAEYERALAQERFTALLEEHTLNFFEFRFGYIDPWESVQVEVVYINKLKRNFDGGALVTIPTSVAPRYETLSLEIPEVLTDESGVSQFQEKGGLNIEISIISNVAISKLESLTHPISSEIGSSHTFSDFASPLEPLGFDSKKARVTFTDHTAALEKDFVLTVQFDAPPLVSQALLEGSPDQCSGPALMVTLCQHEFCNLQYSAEQFECEIIFLADRSESMGGSRMEMLQKAMLEFLKKLPEHCHFNIYSFGSILRPLWLKSRRNSEGTRQAAKLHISSFKADMGDKVILPVLKSVTEHRLGWDTSTQFILLTDGEPLDIEEIVDFAANAARDSRGAFRIFPVVIRYADSHRFFEGIGNQDGGFGEVIVVNRPEKLAGITSRILEGAQLPWKFEVTLSGHVKPGAKSSDTEVVEHPAGAFEYSFRRTAYIQAPCYVYSLNPFAWPTIFFLFQHKQSTPIKSVTVKATLPSGMAVFKEIQVEYARSKSSTIHQLAAKAIMSDLEAGQSWTHEAASESDPSKSQGPISNTAIREEAESIGLKWSIAGKWTSFVAVGHDNEEIVAGSYQVQHSRPVPVENAVPNLDDESLLRRERALERLKREVTQHPEEMRKMKKEQNHVETQEIRFSKHRHMRRIYEVTESLQGSRSSQSSKSQGGYKRTQQAEVLVAEVWSNPLEGYRILYLDLLLAFLLVIILKIVAPYSLFCCLLFSYLLYWRCRIG